MKKKALTIATLNVGFMTIILDPEMKDNLLTVKRKSDWIIWVRMEVNEELLNIIKLYAPQVGCAKTEKDQFRKHVGCVVETIPIIELLWNSGDLNICRRRNQRSRKIR